MAATHAAALLRWNADSYIFSIAVSHDGMRVASGSADNRIRIWNVHTGSLVLHPLRGHTKSVRSVAWSHDDTRLVSGSNDKTIRIWDARTGAPIGEPLRGHDGNVRSVAFSHDSSRIVSGSFDRTIRIWDARTGDSVGKPLMGYSNCDESVAFSYDSTRIISASYDGTVRTWDTRTSNVIGEQLKKNKGSVHPVAFSHDNSRIISCLSSNTVCIWDTRTGALIGSLLSGHRESVVSVAFSHDNNRIVSGLKNMTICVWEAPPSAPLFDTVTSDMSVEEMFTSLIQHGCTDLSDLLDDALYSSSPVANGGFGDVWRVTLRNGSVVAVKTLRLQDLSAGNNKGAKRAAREVHHWSKLQHLNVQKLLGIVPFEGGLGMVSPWAEHGNLHQYLARHSEAPRYPLCTQLVAGVSYLHSVDMVHGDLKANNVLVFADGTLKVNDFDYAVLSGSTLRFSTTTRPGGGTLRWMAPELFLPEMENDEEEANPTPSRNKETDIYALGMTMLEILTGKLPYSECRGDMRIYKAIHSRKSPKRPKELSTSDPQATCMWNILLKCWEYNPSARPDIVSVSTLLNSNALQFTSSSSGH